MPRKKLIYTDLYPYHIRARSNNREWFSLALPECWEIFSQKLKQLHPVFGFRIHAFVLMDNHYHLVGSTTEKHNLGEVMCWFQTSVSRMIAQATGRINHVFGGPYRASLVQDPIYYMNVIKYTYQNPLRAGLCNKVEDYPFSSIYKSQLPRFSILDPLNGIEELLPKNRVDFLSLMNESVDLEMVKRLRMGLSRTVFKIHDPSRRCAGRELKF